MTDVFTPAERSAIMAKVKGRNTKPEIVVRSLLHRMGYRFRLYRKDLPGTPDIVLPRFQTVVEIRSCFFHRHPGCKRASVPSNNSDYWKAKFERNVERDRQNIRKLRELGWKTVVVWECQTADAKRLERSLRRQLQ